MKPGDLVVIPKGTDTFSEEGDRPLRADIVVKLVEVDNNLVYWRTLTNGPLRSCFSSIPTPANIVIQQPEKKKSKRKKKS